MMADIYRVVKLIFIWLDDDEELASFSAAGSPRTIEETEAMADPWLTFPPIGRCYYHPVAKIAAYGGGFSPWEKILSALDLMYQLACNKHAPDILYFRKGSAEGDWELCEVVAEGLACLVSRPWWNRIWVVQEVVLAQMPLSYLVQELSLGPFFQLPAGIGGTISPPAAGPHAQQKVISELWMPVMSIEEAKESKSVGKTNLLAAIDRFRTRAATDERGKVYEILSLVDKWFGLAPIRPDYSLGTLKVYGQVFKYTVWSNRTVNILIGLRNRRNDYPSWLPDPEQSPENYFPLCLSDYKAWNFTPDAQVHGNRLLSLSGIKIDVISSIGEVSRNTQCPETAITIQKWRDMAHLDQMQNQPYLSSGTWEEAFARTICGDMFTTSPNVDQFGKNGTTGRKFQFRRSSKETGKEPVRPIFRRAIQQDWETFLK